MHLQRFFSSKNAIMHFSTRSWSRQSDQVNELVSISECLQTRSKKFSCFHKEAWTIPMEEQIKPACYPTIVDDCQASSDTQQFAF
jgi:hypothetical protein